MWQPSDMSILTPQSSDLCCDAPLNSVCPQGVPARTNPEHFFWIKKYFQKLQSMMSEW